MGTAVARHKVEWCNRSIEWTAVAADGEDRSRVTPTVWSYELDGLTYYGFPFDPFEQGPTTRERALNWLNRHHLIVKREHLARDL
jgi:hypothetical protein